MSDHAVVFAVQAGAVSFQTATDTDQGYPKDGVDIGVGRHASRAEGRTYHYAGLREHPVSHAWALLPFDLVLRSGRVPVPLEGTETDLDASWFPERA